MASAQVGLMSPLRSARSADYDPSRLSWQVAIWFNYAGIYLAVGATLSAMYVLQWAAELTSEARLLAKVNPYSLPAQYLQGKLIPGYYLMPHFEMDLLRQFGMPRRWKYLAHHMVWGPVLGSFSLFVTLTILAFNNEGGLISRPLIIPLVLGILPLGFYVLERFVPVGTMVELRN